MQGQPEGEKIVARFIVLTFGFLGLVFFELSGGTSFDPVAARTAMMDARTTHASTFKAIVETQPRVATSEPATALTPEVTRVALNLTSLSDILSEDAVATEVAPATAVTAPADNSTVANAEPAVFTDEAPAIVLPSIVFPGTITVSSSDAAEASPDTRSVTGDLVNVRGGPGTDFTVVNQLSRGDMVEILDDPGNGWVQLRDPVSGTVGWMADFLLSKS